jgi:hypothetical protein
MCGGIKGKSVVQDIMEFENRQLYYLLYNTPKESRYEILMQKIKKIKIKVKF